MMNESKSAVDRTFLSLYMGKAMKEKKIFFVGSGRAWRTARRVELDGDVAEKNVRNTKFAEIY